MEWFGPFIPSETFPLFRVGREVCCLQADTHDTLPITDCRLNLWTTAALQNEDDYSELGSVGLEGVRRHQ